MYGQIDAVERRLAVAKGNHRGFAGERDRNSLIREYIAVVVYLTEDALKSQPVLLLQMHPSRIIGTPHRLQSRQVCLSVVEVPTRRLLVGHRIIGIRRQPGTRGIGNAHGRRNPIEGSAGIGIGVVSRVGVIERLPQIIVGKAGLVLDVLQTGYNLQRFQGPELVLDECGQIGVSVIVITDEIRIGNGRSLQGTVALEPIFCVRVNHITTKTQTVVVGQVRVEDQPIAVSLGEGLIILTAATGKTGVDAIVENASVSVPEQIVHFDVVRDLELQLGISQIVFNDVVLEPDVGVERRIETTGLLAVKGRVLVETSGGDPGNGINGDHVGTILVVTLSIGTNAEASQGKGLAQLQEHRVGARWSIEVADAKTVAMGVGRG